MIFSLGAFIARTAEEKREMLAEVQDKVMTIKASVYETVKT